MSFLAGYFNENGVQMITTDIEKQVNDLMAPKIGAIRPNKERELSTFVVMQRLGHQSN